MDIKVEYDGSWPSLCSGKLIVNIEGKEWVFPDFCMVSGGSCGFNGDYSEEYVEYGSWNIDEWPEGFPDNLKAPVIEAVNDAVPEGCCGGCL